MGVNDEAQSYRDCLFDPFFISPKLFGPHLRSPGAVKGKQARPRHNGKFCDKK